MRLFGLTISKTRSPEAIASLEVVAARVHRLEIAHRELQEYVSSLAGHHLKLRKQFDGSKGGRPRSQNGQLTLDEVPFGDKAALRKALGVVPRTDAGQENSH